MDHGPSFQALWKRLNAEVQALQRRGYYGDGYWSSGRRLADSAKVSGDGLDAGELPEFMCGGAQSRSRPSARRRGPSTPTSGKARKKHKPSTRVTSKRAFVGEGTVLSEENGKGTGFRKQAGSKRAREERAAAIERRLQLLKSEPKASSSSTANEESESDESDVEIIAETDLERRQALNASEKGEENLKQLRSGTLWDYFQNAFTFDTPPVAADGDEPVVCDVIELSDDDESVQMRSSSTTVNAGPSKPSTRGGKVHALTQTSSSKAPRASTASKPIKRQPRFVSRL
ncbi:hypothetical protein AX16_002388 [Volvariella volvacea WC 439]|nr:hypothetical protein AX16_002388 [Volvariella volvacea WC 439]